MASAPIKFTVNSLCSHLRSELDVDPNATGGAIPDRVLTLVTLAAMELWDGHDWAFKRRQGTLTTVADTATVDFPSDFYELDQRWLHDEANSTGVRFTSDPTEYQRIANDYESADTGEPIIACIQRKTPVYGSVDPADDVTDYALQALLTPTPDAIYNYPYWYMVLNPWSSGGLADDDVAPVWPHTFNEGWRLFAKQKLLNAYGGGSSEKATIGAMCKRWIADQLAENDEMLSRPNEQIRDGYGDFAPRPFSNAGMTNRNFYDY